VLVQANLFAIKKSFLWGIGLRAMRRYSAELDRKGLTIPMHPDYKNIYLGSDSHSTHLGTLAQLRLPGTITLLLLWSIVGYGCYLAR